MGLVPDMVDLCPRACDAGLTGAVDRVTGSRQTTDGSVEANRSTSSGRPQTHKQKKEQHSSHLPGRLAALLLFASGAFENGHQDELACHAPVRPAAANFLSGWKAHIKV